MAKADVITLMMRHPGYNIDGHVIATYIRSYSDEATFSLTGMDLEDLDDARRYASHVVHTIKESGDMWMESGTMFDLDVKLDDGTRHMIPMLQSTLSVQLPTDVVPVQMLGDFNGVVLGLSILFGEWEGKLNRGRTNV